MKKIYHDIQKGYTDAIYEATHFTPNKALGQNFLRNAQIAHNIVNLLPDTENASILEIGPGAGALTRILLEKSAPLTVLEKDPYWAGVHNASTTTICTDALTFPFQKLHSKHGTKWHIIGNLPYNIASPLLWDIVSLTDSYIVCMVQKEVGERIIAEPHTSAYGALSIWIQSFTRPQKEYIVPPSAFFPPPKIDSMVLSFTPHHESIRQIVPKSFSKILKLLFLQRRKQIQKVLRGQFPHIPDVLEELTLPATARAEELPVEILHELTRRLYND